MGVIVRKLLGIGALPDDLRTELAAEGVLLLAESVPVTFKFSGKVPGKTAHGNLRSYVGALALTERRLLAALSAAPRKIGRKVDRPWRADPGSMVHGELDAGGLSLVLPDLSEVGPELAGSMSLHFKVALDPDLLARLPERRFTIDVPTAFVYGACGVART